LKLLFFNISSGNVNNVKHRSILKKIIHTRQHSNVNSVVNLANLLVCSKFDVVIDLDSNSYSIIPEYKINVRTILRGYIT